MVIVKWVLIVIALLWLARAPVPANYLIDLMVQGRRRMTWQDNLVMLLLTFIGLRNAGHIGRAGDYAEMAIRAGLISVHFVNVAGSVLVVADRPAAIGDEPVLAVAEQDKALAGHFSRAPEGRGWQTL